jgi:hypothetical protein
LISLENETAQPQNKHALRLYAASRGKREKEAADLCKNGKIAKQCPTSKN